MSVRLTPTLILPLTLLLTLILILALTLTINLTLIIQENYECEVDLKEDGKAYIFGPNLEMVRDAKMLIEDLVVVVKEVTINVCIIINTLIFSLNFNT
jgi:hypothetical protein